MRKRHVYLGLAVVLLGSAGLFYSNCSSPSNTFQLGSASIGGPQDAYFWRPNRLVSFSCAMDPGAKISQLANFPSIWFSYDTDAINPVDTFPAGFILSADEQAFLKKNFATNPQFITSILPHEVPVLVPITSASDPSTGGGWSYLFASSGASLNLGQNPQFSPWSNPALSVGNPVPLPSAGYRLTILGLNPWNASPSTGQYQQSYGFFFENGAQQFVTYQDSTGSTYLAGEAISFFMSGQGIATANGVSAVYPYFANSTIQSAACSDSVQHPWVCQSFVMMNPGEGSSCTCPSGNCGPAKTFSSLASLGSFGLFKNIPCFVPTAGGCYVNGYDPVNSVMNNPPWLTTTPPYTANYDGTPPHWVTACYRDSQVGGTRYCGN